MISKAKLFANAIRDEITRYFQKDKRSLDCEYGYIENPNFNDLYRYYRRNGLGGGAIVKTNNKVWSEYPEIYRGSESEEDQHRDSYEEKVNGILDSAFWKEFKEADKRRMIGRWSALILYFNDGNEVSMADPVSEGRSLVFVKAAWCNSLTISDRNDDQSPKMWQYTPPKIDGEQPDVVLIHPDRVFILGDISPDGEAFHERGLNNLVNTEKVEGGSAEGYRKNAANMIHINFDPNIDEIGAIDGSGKESSNLRKELNDVGRDLNSGKDSILVTQGADSHQLTSSVADPTSTFMINVQSFCASLPIDISAKILLGNQTGERASTEDLKQFKASCQDYRNWQLTPEIIVFLEKLMRLGVIETNQVGVTWSDLTVPSQLEKVEMAEKMVEVNNKSMMVGGDPIFSGEEIRSGAGFDTSSRNTEI